MSKHKLYTVGYTSFATYKARQYKQSDGIEEFIQILRKFFIDAVVDVRSNPYSAGYEQFDKEALERSLNEHRIFYLFFGEELGARPLDLELYTSGQADFDKMSKAEKFLKGCERLHNGLEKYNICLLCAEQNPIDCHRAILVAHQFRNLYNDIEIYHILKDKKSMSQNTLDEQVLIKNYQRNLFDAVNNPQHKSIVEKAYKKQAKKIAYKLIENNEYI